MKWENEAGNWETGEVSELGRRNLYQFQVERESETFFPLIFNHQRDCRPLDEILSVLSVLYIFFPLSSSTESDPHKTKSRRWRKDRQSRKWEIQTQMSSFIYSTFCFCRRAFTSSKWTKCTKCTKWTEREIDFRISLLTLLTSWRADFKSN